MSAIRKVPNIEEVIGKLTKDEKNDLQEWLDKGGSNIECSLANMPNGINPVFFKLDETIPARSGLLMNTSNVCALIAYHRYQDLELYIIDKTTKTYVKSKEYLDINELRRVLMDVSFSATDLDSGDAELGDILVANGEGGVQFVSPREVESDEHVVTFDNVTFTDNQVVLPLSESDVRWDYMQDTTTDCVLVLRLSSGTQVEMRRIHYDTDYVEFGSTLNQEVDGNGKYMSIIYSAKFIETGGVAVIVEFEANKDLSSSEEEYPYLSNITIGGETYYVVDIALINEINAELVEKANVDGNYPTMTVGVADQLSPYDDESGADQDEPFSFQATGTANGTLSDFATGSIAQLKEKRGNTVVVNQLNNNNGTTGDNSGITYTKNNDGSWTLSGTATALSYRTMHQDINFTNGHKYLILTTKPNDNVGFYVYNNSQQVYPLAPTYGNSFVFTSSYTLSANLVFIVKDATDLTTPLTTKVYLIDLTQWFGSNSLIPQDLLDNPSNFFRYYSGSLAYNTGELVNANSRYIKCIGMNQWDEEWEQGGISPADGTTYTTTSAIRSKNYIRVIPGADYYFYNGQGSYGQIAFYDKDKNFISGLDWTSAAYFNRVNKMPSNACYIKFMTSGGYGGSYLNNITISIYYEDESGYDQYYPYEVLTNNDTGTEVLRSAGSVKDTKAPDGTITRNVGNYTFTGEESWTTSNNAKYMNSALPNAKGYGSTTKANITTNTGLDIEIAVNLHDSGNGIGIDALGRVWVGATQVSLLTGKTIYYELATPTTEQGTPFSENLLIDDFGSMDFSGTSGVPQGNLIFYPVDYKAFIDTLYDYTDGTPSNLAKNESITDAALNARGYYKMQDLSSDCQIGTGLTVAALKLMKIGRMTVLTLRAKNTSGAALTAYSTLVTLPATADFLNWMAYPIMVDNVEGTAMAVLSNNTITSSIDIPNNASVYINLAYVANH